VLIDDQHGRSVWAGGFLGRATKPTGDELLAIFRQDALDAFHRRGETDGVPDSIHVAHLHELPDPPVPPEDIPLRRWLIAVDYVCHDAKYGSSGKGVFVWPEKPAGDVLDRMARVLIADSLAIRGTGPDYSDYSDILKLTVEETDVETDYPPGGSETPIPSS
jgi:hypothetical protein